METIKKYWWLFLLMPIGVYLIWVYYKAKNEVNASTARAREAKAVKKMLSEIEVDNETEAILNEGSNTNG
jgi:hypothetical protein